MLINGWSLNISKDFENKIKELYKAGNITPKEKDTFNAFKEIKPEHTNVIFIGQDPYPKEGDAHGLSFSVKRDENLPASLKNIYKELKNDLGVTRKNGDLTKIANQGVLFLNTILTTEIGKPKSHHGIGWELITKEVIINISNKGNKIFVLLGKDAQELKRYINVDSNITIETSHPSPLSAYRGFMGSKIFSEINKELKLLNKKEINWNE